MQAWNLPMILYIFAFLMIIFGLMFEYALGMTIITGWTADSIDTIIGRHDPTDTIQSNPAFIFGDFGEIAKAWVALLFGTVSGGMVYDVFAQFPFMNDYAMMLIRGIYTFGTFLGALQILTGRLG